MNDRDRIQALWLNLEMIMNALDQSGENVRFSERDADYAAHGVSGRVGWDQDTDRWEASVW
jgi:hypothetical protein